MFPWVYTSGHHKCRKIQWHHEDWGQDAAEQPMVQETANIIFIIVERYKSSVLLKGQYSPTGEPYITPFHLFPSTVTGKWCIHGSSLQIQQPPSDTIWNLSVKDLGKRYCLSHTHISEGTGSPLPGGVFPVEAQEEEEGDLHLTVVHYKSISVKDKMAMC